MFWELAKEYLTFDYNDVSNLLREALPADLILFVLFVVAVWFALACLVLLLLSQTLTEGAISTARKVFQFLAVTCGGLGVVLFVLDSRASSVSVDFSSETTKFEESVAEIWKGLELSRDYCSPGPLQALTPNKDILSRDMILCAWQGEVSSARGRVQSLRLEPVFWASARVDLSGQDEPDADALADAYKQEFVSAHTAIQQLADDYLEFANDLGFPTDGALALLDGFEDRVAEAAEANSSVVSTVLLQLWSDEALRRLRSATIVFLTVLAAGMALELALLVFPAPARSGGSGSGPPRREDPSVEVISRTES